MEIAAFSLKVLTSKLLLQHI